MNRSGFLYSVLATIGVGAMLAYLVACRPSWHPDGTKILFSYGDAEKGPSGIAMLDRTTGKTRSVFVTPPGRLLGSVETGRRPADRGLDSRRSRAGSTESGHSFADVPETIADVYGGDIDTDNMLIGFPLPEIDGAVFVSGDSLMRLDLESGDIKQHPIAPDNQLSLLGHGDVLYYALVSDRKHTCELGTVDTTDLSLHPVNRLTVPEDDEIAPLVLAATSVDGSIMVVPAKRDGKFQIMMLSGCKVQKSIAVALDAKVYQLGNLQLAPDKKTIYAAVIPDESEDEIGEDITFGTPDQAADEPANEALVKLGIAEIAVESEELRLTPMSKVHGDNDFSVFDWQIALSPDGKTLAVGGSMMDKGAEDPSDTALHLVDLTDPDRKVTRFRAPK